MKVQQDDSEFRCKSLLEEAVTEGAKYLQKNSFLEQRIREFEEEIHEKAVAGPGDA